MPKRKSRKSGKSKKTISRSTTGSDIRSSQFSNCSGFPLATSSPQASIFITVEEIEENVKRLQADFKKSLNESFEERSTKLESSFQEVLSAASCDWESSISDMKMLRKLYNGMSKDFSLNGNSLGKTMNMVGETISSLPSIPEEGNLSPGGSGETHKSEGNAASSCSDARPGSSTSGSKEKKLKIISDKMDEDDSVFKKPRATGKRTLKSSQASNSLFRTPKTISRAGYSVAMVTPGPNSSRPVNVLRRPVPGEMVISMDGSPLHIAHNNIHTNVPEISIPLSDGRIITVLADEGLDPDMSICSDIAPETRDRLAVLQKLLSRKTRAN